MDISFSCQGCYLTNPKLSCLKELMIKLGCVPYMNALPLTYGLDPQEVELIHRPPSELLELLQVGQVEAALLPIVNYFENPDLYLVPGLAIACRGEVKSVKLYFNSPVGALREAPLQEIKTLYLDPESRTSHALLKVILHHKYGINLNTLTFTSNLSHPNIDTRLLIGDKTFQEKGPSLDLGEEWWHWQKKPFVFAAWMTPQAQNSTLVKILQKSKKSKTQGLQNIDKIIVQRERMTEGHSLKDYFTKNIHYTMEEAELEGIRRFYELLKPLQGYHHELNFRFVS